MFGGPACAHWFLSVSALSPEILRPCQRPATVTTGSIHVVLSSVLMRSQFCGQFAVSSATLCCRPASPAETRVQPARHETPTSSHRGPSRRAPPLPPMLSGGGRLSGKKRKRLSRPLHT